MGSYVELNNTLQITSEQGFPVNILNLKKHKKSQIQLKDVAGKIFKFQGKVGARIFPISPSRCFLVHNIKGKWLYWGMVRIIEQTIKGELKDSHVTSGKYKIIKIYDPEYQGQITKHEAPEGLSYF